MDWDKLRVFHAVTVAGSFTKASEILHISQSAIGRQVGILENHLGTPLFRRVSRGVELTEAGETLQNAVLRVSAKLETVQATLLDLKNQPWGPLHVVTSLSFGSLWLAPRLQAFLEAYPAVQVTLSLKEDGESFSLQDADIGITELPVAMPDIVQSKPFRSRFHAYASHTYLKQAGTPTKLKELMSHRLLGFGDKMVAAKSPYNWLVAERTPSFVANSGQALYEAAKAGQGIAVLPTYMVNGEMVKILEDLVSPTVIRHVVYPSHLANLKRVEAFVTFLTTQLNQEE